MRPTRGAVAFSQKLTFAYGERSITSRNVGREIIEFVESGQLVLRTRLQGQLKVPGGGLVRSDAGNLQFLATVDEQAELVDPQISRTPATTRGSRAAASAAPRSTSSASRPRRAPRRRSPPRRPLSRAAAIRRGQWPQRPADGADPMFVCKRSTGRSDDFCDAAEPALTGSRFSRDRVDYWTAIGTSVSIVAPEAIEMDEDHASASARWALTALLHPRKAAVTLPLSHSMPGSDEVAEPTV